MARRKWSWTTLQEDRAQEVLTVVNGLKPYWPLTLRQIYYQLVSKGQVKNDRSHYNMLSKLIKWMRIYEKLPWRALEDRTRTVTTKRGYQDIDAFVSAHIDSLFYGYSRCLVQGQPKYIEVWTEKDALLGIFDQVVWPYCIRVVVCRGYNSVTLMADFFKRAEQAIMKGQEPVVLYFGDLDPSGVQMLQATKETLENELGLYGVEFKRVALNLDQIDQYNLPHDPEAIKTSDPRYKWYVKRFGDMAVELDALHPEDLTSMIKNTIEHELNMEVFNQQHEIEIYEGDRLDRFREDIKGLVKEHFPYAFY